MAAPRATLDFFAAQAAARRRTAVLVVWFALALAGTFAVIWAGVAGVCALSASPGVRTWASSPELAAAVGLAVVVVTAIGTLGYHDVLSAGGGEKVAQMLGGVRVDRRTQHPGERRLVNVVEEMAIAAGLPVPALYVLPEERGINAFAAGLSADRAVVAVTRGALDELDRDELQGVVAHELSHVLNGDARLNLQLLALVGGITALAAMGRFLAHATSRRSRWSSRRGGGAGLGFLAAGLCVWLAGSVGAFFGKVIRAAVSRQREYLADAAAVQFTRNPDGLAGALAKIARAGSALGASLAPEAAHLFFANGLASPWLATHPPVEERLRRLVPQGFRRVMARARAAAPAPPPPRAVAPPPLTASAVVASVGHPGPAHVARAAQVLSELPVEVVVAAREPASAAALARALLAADDGAARLGQLADLAPAVRPEAARLAGALDAVTRSARMAVLDLALPSLDALPPDEAARLVADLGQMAGADRRTTLFEWAVLRIVSRRLAPGEGVRARAPRAAVLEAVQVDALDVLSALAWAGARDEARAQAALDSALGVLGVRGWRVLPRDRLAGSRLEAALARLEGATAPLQARLVEACAAAALSDGQVRAAEGEIVRAVAASLGVPVPPLVPAAAAGASSGAGTA